MSRPDANSLLPAQMRSFEAMRLKGCSWHIPEVAPVVSDGRLRFQGGLGQAGPGRVYEFTP